MRDQIQLLLALYWRPVRAASRIIDEGRIWFAIFAAVLAIVAMQFGTADTIQKYVQPSQIEAEQDDELPTQTPSGDPLVAMLGLTLEPTATLKFLPALALAFLPAVVLVITLSRSHESFAVVLRKDYLPLLNCLLLSVAAAPLPVAIRSQLLAVAP